MADTHKFVGSHPQDFFGRMLAPGDTFTPTKEQLEDPSVKDMLNTGQIMNLARGGE